MLDVVDHKGSQLTLCNLGRHHFGYLRGEFHQEFFSSYFTQIGNFTLLK